MKLLALVCLAASALFAGGVELGQPLTLKKQIAIGKLTAKPDKHVGKTVQVKGTVREVCQHMGCWMEIADRTSGKAIRIKVRDGEIVFPQEAVGKTVIAEGKLARLELTREQAIARAKHEAEENNRPFNPESINSGFTFYQIQGTGAVILD